MLAGLVVVDPVGLQPTPTAEADTRVADTPVVRRGADYHVKNSMSAGPADSVFRYGRSGDEVWFTDTDGNGTDTPVVRRGKTLYVKNSLSAGEADAVVDYGRAGDQLFFADLDGDGAETPIIRRGATFYVRNSLTTGAADVTFTYGRPSDEVLFGDVDGDGVATVVLRRGATFYVRNSLTTGPADVTFTYGRADDEVYLADVDGNGTDLPVVRRANQFYVRSSLGGGAADQVVAYGRAGDVVYFGRWTPPPTALELELTRDVERSWRLGRGYAENTVNAASFRKESLTSGVVAGVRVQYAAYYDDLGRVVIAKRVHDSDSWQTKTSSYRGPIQDAHNVISIGLDGQGYLHVSWGMHGHPLSYARTTTAGGLALGPKQSMIGTLEDAVTYPQFLPTTDGDLFFLYRHGRSGNGDVVLNRLDVSANAGAGQWSRVADALISGENARSAYWQAVTDDKGRLHLSWTFRRTTNVATNSDVMYAVATDATGRRWVRSDGTAYALPITQATAEKVARVPEGSNLMNQTAMTLDDAGQPFIATYLNTELNKGGTTQYAVIRHDDAGWHTTFTGFRSTAADLAGNGTLALPLSRPNIAVRGTGAQAQVFLMLRDAERGNVATVARTQAGGIGANRWELRDLTAGPVHSWEPTYDTRLWHDEGVLELYLQYAAQGNHETTVPTSAAQVYVVRVALGKRPAAAAVSASASTSESTSAALPRVAPSSEPSASLGGDPSPEPTASLGGDPSPEPSVDPSPEPSGDPSPEPSVGASAAPSGAPSPEPSGAPSPEPSGDPSAEPSGDPSAAVG
ncbi:BNR-4 repeat-containing protein [Puerhibacterium puerhi]|uniref:BNR-4 repeat-containing protein n=1 Tax=Puerhibacterium puerhi TaxID=2692623 RepID=UPI001359069E|nr:BNR-4 repeat-containing protein [Puerhibacterium puerhi]